MTATAKVLNGEVRAGDTIAYSSHGGSSHDMSIGEVVAIGETQDPWSLAKPTLKVKMTSTSGVRFEPDKIVTLTVLGRVVKLGAEQVEADQSAAPEVLSEYAQWLTEFKATFEAFFNSSFAADPAGAVTKSAAGGLAMLEVCAEQFAGLVGE